MKYDIQSGLYLPNRYRRPSPFDRMTLQWFANLFTADGETGDTSQWSSVDQYGSSTFAINETIKHGNYSFKFTSDAVPSGAYGAQNIAAQSELYVGFSLYLPSTIRLLGEWSVPSILTFYAAGPTFIGYVGVVGDGSGPPSTPEAWTSKFKAEANQYSITNFSLDEWHFVLMRFLQNAGSGGIQVWIDGDSVAALGNMDNDTSGDAITIVTLGGDYVLTFNSGAFFYVDDVEGDTAYIEPYSEGGGGSSIVPLLLQQRRRRM
jgi:hypothetical protein